MDPLKQLHASFGIDEAQLSRLRAEALSIKGSDPFCDIYFEKSRAQALTYDDHNFIDPTASQACGAGIRVVDGEAIGYGSTTDLTLSGLLAEAQTARAIAAAGGPAATTAIMPSAAVPSMYALRQSLFDTPLDEQMRLMQEIDAAARRDPRIRNVTVSLGMSEQTIVINTWDGRLVADKRPLIRLNVSCAAADGKRQGNGSAGMGGRLDYGFLTANLQGKPRWHELVEEATGEALALLQAQPAPAGEMIVVLGSGLPGVILHEAVGHGLEGDFNRKKLSKFSGLIGQRVAPAGVTVVDQGNIADRRGSLTVDDEGTPTGSTVLIEDGILRRYMLDVQSARLMGLASTGNGRRQSFAHVPMVRMTNTYMLSGDAEPDEIVRSVKRGIYCPRFGGGQVDITNGDFTFSCTIAYLIEDGKLTVPLIGATLVGNGADALMKVTMVGNDSKLDNGIGTCGKNGQQVPVGVGQPTMRLDGITVGGTKH